MDHFTRILIVGDHADHQPSTGWTARHRAIIDALTTTGATIVCVPFGSDPRTYGRADLGVGFLPGASSALIRMNVDKRVFIVEERWHHSFLLNFQPPSIPARVRRLSRFVSLCRELERAMSCVDRVVTLSTDEASYFARAYGVSPVVLPHFVVDPPPFRPPRQPGTPPLVGAYGYMSLIEHRPELLRMMAALKDASWELAGWHNSADYIWGTTPNRYESNIWSFLSKLDVLIVPHVRGQGVKTSVLEAWALGVPVVVVGEPLRGTEASPGVHYALSTSSSEVEAGLHQAMTSHASLAAHGFALFDRAHRRPTNRALVAAVAGDDLASER